MSNTSINHIGVQIANNVALSGEIDIGELRFLAIEFPTTWPAGATTISFQGKSTQFNTEGVNPPIEQWRDIYDDTGTEITIAAGQNRFIALGTAVKMAIANFRYLRIRVGTSAAPVNISPLQQIRVIGKSLG